jgi:hypothetical protein
MKTYNLHACRSRRPHRLHVDTLGNPHNGVIAQNITLDDSDVTGAIRKIKGTPSVSSDSIVSDYGLDDRGSIPGRAEDFSSSPCVQTGSGAHPTSYPMGTGGPFPGGKVRPGRDADHSPPSSAEVNYE